MFLLTLEFISLSLVIIVLLMMAVAYYTLYKTSWMGKRYYDMPESWQMTFQDPATIVMEGISDLHHDIMYFMVLISAFAFWMIFMTVYTYSFNSYLQLYSQFWKKYLVWHNPKVLHSTQTYNYQVEVIWTVVPSLILLMMAVPSFALLFKMDEVTSPDMTFKTVGTKLYWTYDYNNLHNRRVEVESYMNSEPLLTPYVIRTFGYSFMWNLNILPLPENVPVKLCMMSPDIMHSKAWEGLTLSLNPSPGSLYGVTLLVKDDILKMSGLHNVSVNSQKMPVLAGTTQVKGGHNMLWYWALRPSKSTILSAPDEVGFSSGSMKMLYKSIKFIYTVMKYSEYITVCAFLISADMMAKNL